MAAKAYRVYYAKVPNNAAPDTYLMDHSTITYLMDPLGKFLKHISYSNDSAALAKALEEAMADEGNVCTRRRYARPVRSRHKRARSGESSCYRFPEVTMPSNSTTARWWEATSSTRAIRRPRLLGEPRYGAPSNSTCRRGWTYGRQPARLAAPATASSAGYGRLRFRRELRRKSLRWPDPNPTHPHFLSRFRIFRILYRDVLWECRCRCPLPSTRQSGQGWTGKRQWSLLHGRCALWRC